MPGKIKLLSFDLDDTLWPCYPVIHSAEELLYQWMKEHVPVLTQHYDINRLREKRHQLLEEYPELAHDMTKLRIRSFEQLSSELDLTLEWIKPAFEIFYEARQKVTLYDDVRPVLDELKRDYQLVSLTNGNASTEKTGVGHWFDFSLSSAIVGKLKAEPDIYLQVLERAGIESNQMIHFGDHPLHDIAGAQSAGVGAVWLNRDDRQWTMEECYPDAIINSLHEIPSLLKTL
jgi:putative hydrolase of the HAD superfamily